MHWFNITLIFLCVFNALPLTARFQFDRVDYVKILERHPDSLDIRLYIPLKSSEERAFAKEYWKVYYQREKIVGEELYIDNQLSYYYLYYHTPEKIYQKGFYWHGIYRDIKYFKAHGKHIKQGWIYKNYPETYRVYDNKGKLTYQHNYLDFES